MSKVENIAAEPEVIAMSSTSESYAAVDAAESEVNGPLDPELPAETYARCAALVESIRSGETDGMEELYELFSRGIRFLLCRQLGPQESDDKLHDTFVLVVQAIRRGELREPERLMGFVRTIVRRQIASHIDRAVKSRREEVDVEAPGRLSDPRGNPEEIAIFRQQTDLVQLVLSELPTRDREILSRFYLQEQSQQQICQDMMLTETQFRLVKSRAKVRFGELGKKKLAHRTLQPVMAKKPAGSERTTRVRTLQVSWA